MTGSELPFFPFDTPSELDAEPEYAELRREDPVPKVRLPLGGEAYLVSRYEDVKRVLTDPVFSRAATSDPGVATLRPVRRNPYLMLSLDAPEHTRVRRLVARAFTPRSIELLRPRVDRIVDELIDAMVAQSPPVDFVAAFAAPLPALVISEMVGAPASDMTMLRDWMDIGLSITAHKPQEIQAAGEQLFGYLERLIAAKRAEPADDLMTRLIQARDEQDRLSEPELLNNIYLLLIGGYETTAGLLANSLLTLHRHPGQLAMLREDPELIPDAIEEVLRYVRIVKAVLERVATRDVRLSGVTVPAGSTVLALHYSANRDDALIEDPDRFDITRAPSPHLTFGGGLHFCLGASLARLELRAAFEGLLRRLPGLRPAVDASEVEWKSGSITRGPVALPVTW
ncbi:cytochrome P450 [Nonomuraea sp. NPDC026600]|uniref:cytochrome P450 n=1 Tax=Nonomuraea sp. NPDC026600 TaxID=3155363 RepID=UPI0033DA9AEC